MRRAPIVVLAAAVVLVVAMFAARPSGQTGPQKVLISVDMEGVAGTVTGRSTRAGGLRVRAVSRVHDA